MNKNLFLGMFVAASMLFTTSCSNDELEVAQSGNEAQVTFSLGLEDGIGSRAISDGTGAKKLIYAVYKLNAEKNAELQKVVGSDENSQFIKTDFKPSGDNVTITLAKGQTYQVAFWAQNPNSSAYDTKDLTKVGVNYTNASNNNESRDAFFKTVEFTVTGSTKIDVVMKRPFAQINVGVTEEDWEAAVGSGIEIEKSSVVIKNAANEINLLDGSVNGNVVVSYALQTIPTDTLMVDLDGDKIRETSYKWLSMSYILPNDEISGYEKTTLDNISFVFAPKSGNNIEFSEGLNAVPVQRNWRTNILGKLLTGDIRFDIVVDPNYEDDYNVQLPYASINGVAYKTFADAMAAVKDGETIKLEGETTLEVKDAHLFTIENKSITIDLNGYGIVGNIPDITTHSSIFQVKKGGELTIEGDGNVKVSIGKTGNFISAFVYNNGGTVNLKGGNWTMTAYDNWQDALIPTFVDNSSNSHSATLNIYDGTYTFHRNIFRNHANSSKNVATMNIYGGTFNGREDNAGGIWNHNPANLSVGAGVIKVMGGTFNNVEIDDDFGVINNVSTVEDLQKALDAAVDGAVIYFKNDITGDVTVTQMPDVKITILGQGYKLNGTITVDGKSARYATTGLTIQNVNFTSDDNITADANINLGNENIINNTRYTSNVTVKDCTFSTTATKDVVAVKSYTGGDYDLNIIGCTVNTGMHSLAQVTNIEKGLKFEGCKVYSKNGINLNNTPTFDMDDCTFDTKGYAVRVGVNGSLNTEMKTFNISNSTLKSAGDDGDAVIIFRDNAKYAILNLTNTTLTGTTEISGATNATIVIIDGATAVSTADGLTAAIKKGGKIVLINDIIVEKWIMFSETKTIGNGNIITVEMNGLTIDGKDHTLTVNSIESAGNGNHLFDNASNLNISNLTIQKNCGAGAISLNSGVISKVNFVGGGYGIHPGAGEITVEECTFATADGDAIYFEQERDNLTVTGCTFNQLAGENVILLRGDVKFTNNIVNSGRTVNIVSGSPVVTGNNFSNVRLKVYSAATATISNNTIKNLVFEDGATTYASTFTNNTLSVEAEAVLGTMNKN